MKKKAILTTILFVLTISSLFAQNNDITIFNLNRNIKLQSTSERKEIPLDITSNTVVLKLKIDCQLYYNELSIEIIDPNGKKMGSFTVENMRKHEKGQKATSLEEKYTELVAGQIDKEITNPIKGKWVIQIAPKNEVHAEINISTKQYLKE